MSTKPFSIRVDDLTAPAVHALLREHLAGMAVHSPAESIHALDLSGLRQPGITFWTAWRGDVLMGCGALREIDPQHGEIKSMRTASAHLRQGVARSMLAHVLAQARQRGYRRVSLETGSGAAFEPAHRLYAAAGFVRCGPFAEYRDDPFSVFMTCTL